MSWFKSPQQSQIQTRFPGFTQSNLQLRFWHWNNLSFFTSLPGFYKSNMNNVNFLDNVSRLNKDKLHLCDTSVISVLLYGYGLWFNRFYPGTHIISKYLVIVNFIFLCKLYIINIERKKIAEINGLVFTW